MLGTGILWFGWFGFNAGSALAANGQAAQAFINTFLAAAEPAWCGRSWSGSATATPPTSALHPASSPGSSRSRPPPALSSGMSPIVDRRGTPG